LISNAE